MNFAIEIKFRGGISGSDATLGETLLKRFLAVAPASDPVVSQDAMLGEATINLSISARDGAEASEQAIAIVRLAAGDFDASAPLTALHVDATDNRWLVSA
jgi:hypothetical protein